MRSCAHCCMRALSLAGAGVYAGPCSPQVPALCSPHSAAGCPTLIAGLFARMAESDFSGPFIIGFGSSPSRCRSARYCGWSDTRSPGPYKERAHMPGSATTPGRLGTCNEAPRRVAFRPLDSLGTRNRFLSRLIGCPMRTLSTLRSAPRDAPRMTRGQHDSLHLCCQGLAPLTPCRSPGAPKVSAIRPRTNPLLARRLTELS